MIDFNICKPEGTPDYIKLAGLVIYIGLETYLGKTEKLKAGSTPELIFNLLRVIFRRKPKDQ